MALIQFVKHGEVVLAWTSKGLEMEKTLFCVVITVCLLHVHMLEIVQLMCYIGLCSHHVCIPKSSHLEHWANLSPRLLVMYSPKFAFLIALNFDNESNTKVSNAKLTYLESPQETKYDIISHNIPQSKR